MIISTGPSSSEGEKQRSRFGQLRGQILSIADLRRVLGCSRSFIYQSLFNTGVITRHKRGSRTVIFGDDVADYLESL